MARLHPADHAQLRRAACIGATRACLDGLPQHDAVDHVLSTTLAFCRKHDREAPIAMIREEVELVYLLLTPAAGTSYR